MTPADGLEDTLADFTRTACSNFFLSCSPGTDSGGSYDLTFDGLQVREDQNIEKRMNHDAGFKARVALGTVKGERTGSELCGFYGVHPTMLHQWKKALLDGVADIFERESKKAPKVDEDTMRALQARSGELAVAIDFLV